MDGARIVAVAGGQAGAIATRRLGACSGLVVLGRSAAIMAHIAPRSNTASVNTTDSEQHFRDLLGQVAQLFISHRGYFPSETTAWGFYISNFSLVTNALVAIATQQFHMLGLHNQHTYYDAFVEPNRRDEVRACVLLGPSTTLFYIEARLVEQISFPRLSPLPDRFASNSTGQVSQRNFLVWSSSAGTAYQMLYGQQVEPDRSRLSGVYEIYHVDPRGRKGWIKYNFDTDQWVA